MKADNIFDYLRWLRAFNHLFELRARFKTKMFNLENITSNPIKYIYSERYYYDEVFES